MFDVNKWNAKIYRDENGEFVEGDKLDDEKLWEEFGIKSGPKFRDACWSGVPVKWTDDVRFLIKQVKDELKDRIEFAQIKEKWCRLTIYFTAKDKEAEKRFVELKRECISKLIEKGIHPNNEEMQDE